VGLLLPVRSSKLADETKKKEVSAPMTPRRINVLRHETMRFRTLPHLQRKA
jgi:hypothetical protein